MGWKETIKILNHKAQQAVTTPEEREAELVREQEEIVANGERQASNLRGSLAHEKGKLDTANAAVTSAKSDYKLAVEMAKDGGRDPNSDPIVTQKLSDVSTAMQAVTLQQSVVTGLEQAVESTRQAVEAAHAKLVQLEQTLTTDQAKAAATSAISGAATVVNSFGGLNTAGSQVAAEHDAIDEQFEQSKARLEDAQGPQAERDFEAAKHAHDLDSLRAQLDAE